MNFKQWFNVFLVISEAWQGYDLKAYGVLNHNLKLQCKKFSRTRDIPNFPTQGWAGTAFCTRKRSETYIYWRKEESFFSLFLLTVQIYSVLVDTYPLFIRNNALSSSVVFNAYIRKKFHWKFSVRSTFPLIDRWPTACMNDCHPDMGHVAKTMKNYKINSYLPISSLHSSRFQYIYNHWQGNKIQNRMVSSEIV